MRNRSALHSLRRSSFFFGVAIAFACTSAQADESLEPQEVIAKERQKAFRHFAVTLNPVSVGVGRFGANFEFLPVKHHAIIVNPFIQRITPDSAGIKTKYSNYGGELGYRFYSDDRGAGGLFLGPFITYFSSSATTTTAGTTKKASFDGFGGGVDVGVQHLFDVGLSLGLGFGFQWLKSEPPKEAQTLATVKFDGVRPRFLATAGWAF